MHISGIPGHYLRNPLLMNNNPVRKSSYFMTHGTLKSQLN